MKKEMQNVEYRMFNVEYRSEIQGMKNEELEIKK